MRSGASFDGKPASPVSGMKPAHRANPVSQRSMTAIVNNPAIATTISMM
jgi:hypothetical protein